MSYKLNLKDITKKYGSRIILDHLDFEFDNDHTYIISGTNGCGKSTLLNIIAGYDHDYVGVCETNKLKVAYLLQDDLLFRNLSVREDLLLQLHALKRTDLSAVDDVADKLGLGNLLNHKVAELSGGEKKKVALGQIILTNADVILLDEPTSSIQKEYAQELMELVYREFKDNILIIASHDKINLDDEAVVKLEIKDGRMNYGI
ncbi:MAG: ATP-binding cassette domain-containing protein [Lactobacillus sp.]|nr:ATP-binding cassette domain-containing protein [Lactobacillus sp.]